MRRIDFTSRANDGTWGPGSGPADGGSRADDGGAAHLSWDTTDDYPGGWESDWIDLGGEA